jgi:two-component system phosphate regulon sensor histidine kinase PhoR
LTTAKIFLKLILGVLFVLVVALSTVDFLASKVAERYYVETLTRELAGKGKVIQLVSSLDLLSQNSPQFAALAHAAGVRLTAVTRDGRVLADSEANPTNMENHATRPEVATALQGRVGSAIRTSATVGIKFLYVAVPAEWGTLRLAVPLKEIDAQVSTLRKQLIASVILAFLPAILIAALFARYVSQRLASIIEYAGKLARGDFHARLRVTRRDELGQLGNQLNETGAKLEKMFQELQSEHEQLERLERVRKDFVINVSHELRTPLASIQGYTETLLDGAIHEPEHNVKFLSIIRQNSERLGRLVADLMTLSRIELKNTKFQFASYRVNGLIDDCVDSLRPLFDKKGIRVHIERAPDKAEVFCDSEAVHQMIGNLVENAVKYTAEGGSIYIGARVLENETRIQFYVRDTGIGIPTEELPRLFERFYRVDKARSRQLGGTGLGLAIVKHLALAQGGEVGVESKPNNGSTFSFILPVQDLGLIEYGTVQPELTKQ